MDQNTAAKVFSIDQSRSPQVLMVEMGLPKQAQAKAGSAFSWSRMILPISCP